ncbi:MAG: heavy metal sensor histidine kinase [Acidobacteria bacterium]|nr:heavy metal sensor histidine kinase [Acidobacteriota bacterium]
MTLAIRSRLALVYSTVFGLLLTATGFVSYRVLAHQLDADATATLTELSSGLHGYVHFEAGVPTVRFDSNDPDQAGFIHEATRFYQIFDANSGRLIVQSDEIEALGLQFTPAEARALRDRLRWQDVRTDYGRIRILNTIMTPGPGQKYLLQVGISLDGTDRALDRFLTLLFLTLPVGLVAAILAGRWMAGIALAPLSRLALAARTIDVADLTQRVPVRGTGDELDEVARAFNEALERLERAIDEMRQFSTALAHELRTPLAALRGEIETAMVKPAAGGDHARRLASQLEEIDKLKRLIDQILLLARADAGEILLALGRVNLVALAASLVGQLDPVAQAKGIDLRCECASAVFVQGDAEWLKRVLLNLIDNALKFTPTGGHILVDISSDESVARLIVRDTGVGIPPEARSHLFERFFRADPARSPGVEGAGLGLSLAKWIVDRHHGDIQVESQPGQGSTFTVRLPLAAQ